MFYISVLANVKLPDTTKFLLNIALNGMPMLASSLKWQNVKIIRFPNLAIKHTPFLTSTVLPRELVESLPTFTVALGFTSSPKLGLRYPLFDGNISCHCYPLLFQVKLQVLEEELSNRCITTARILFLMRFDYFLVVL